MSAYTFTSFASYLAHCPDCRRVASHDDVFCWVCGAVVCSAYEREEDCGKCFPTERAA